jgi:hypothetical protein
MSETGTASGNVFLMIVLKSNLRYNRKAFGVAKFKTLRCFESLGVFYSR